MLLKGTDLKPGGLVPPTPVFDSLNDANITYWCEGDGIIWYKVLNNSMQNHIWLQNLFLHSRGHGIRVLFQILNLRLDLYSQLFYLVLVA